MVARTRKFRVGDEIRILNEDGQYGPWIGRTWIVSSIAYSRADHPGYDEGLNGMGLIDCEGLPVSLYEYEIEKV